MRETRNGPRPATSQRHSKLHSRRKKICAVKKMFEKDDKKREKQWLC
jgi:hypothetical protein